MSGRCFKSWPGDDATPNESKPSTVETPDACSLCGATDWASWPAHLRNDCTGSDGR